MSFVKWNVGELGCIIYLVGVGRFRSFAPVNVQISSTIIIQAAIEAGEEEVSSLQTVASAASYLMQFCQISIRNISL